MSYVDALACFGTTTAGPVYLGDHPRPYGCDALDAASEVSVAWRQGYVVPYRAVVDSHMCQIIGGHGGHTVYTARCQLWLPYAVCAISQSSWMPGLGSVNTEVRAILAWCARGADAAERLSRARHLLLQVDSWGGGRCLLPEGER